MASKACSTTQVGTPEQDKALHEAIAALHGEVSLVQILQSAQGIYGYLPEKALEVIATELGVSSEQVYSVATFYSQFNFTPKGKYAISVCLGTACYVKGSQAVLDKIVARLGCPVGSISPDGKYSVDANRCVGACGLAPVIMINDDVYGRLVPDDLPAIVEKYRTM